MTGSVPDSEMDSYESGPYCEHWDTPGLCKKCAVKMLRDAGYTVIEPSRKAAKHDEG